MVRSIVRLHGKNMHTLTAENLSCLEERLIILDRGHSAQTVGLPIGSETVSFPEFPCRRQPRRTWAWPQLGLSHSLTDADGLGYFSLPLHAVQQTL
jgi:hypothetical protein